MALSIPYLNPVSAEGEPLSMPVVYFDDFLDGRSHIANNATIASGQGKFSELANLGDWLVTLVDGGGDNGEVIRVADDGVGGLLTLTTNDADNDSIEMQMNGEAWQLALGKDIVFEVRLKGADISEFADFNAEEGSALAQKGQETLFDYIEALQTPVIALINGFALGGGLELAMAAHFRIASDTARMGLPETSLGLIPGYGGTQRLPQLIGKGRALEMIMTAGMIDANQALQYGLVNHVTTPDDLLDFAKKLAGKILKNSGVAIAAAIQAVNAGFDYDKDGYQAEINAFGKAFSTADFKEGTQAFLEKRKADFPGN